MSSSIIGCLPSYVVFHHKLSSIVGRLPSFVVFHRRSSSIICRLPSKVFFHRRSSSIDGLLPSKVVFLLRAAPELPPSCPRATPEVNQAKWAWSFRQKVTTLTNTERNRGPPGSGRKNHWNIYISVVFLIPNFWLLTSWFLLKLHMNIEHHCQGH